MTIEVKLEQKHVDRLNHLIHILETTPADVPFDLYTWNKKVDPAKPYKNMNLLKSVEDFKECGYAGCACGWAAADPQMKEWGLKYDAGGYISFDTEDSHLRDWPAVNKFFGIPSTISELLFQSKCYFSLQKKSDTYIRFSEYKVSPKDVANRIKMLLSGKINDVPSEDKRMALISETYNIIVPKPPKVVKEKVEKKSKVKILSKDRMKKRFKIELTDPMHRDKKYVWSPFNYQWERLKEFKKYLKSIDKEKFNMSTWNEPKEDNLCGTSACALGWACVNPKFNKEGLKFKLHNGSKIWAYPVFKTKGKVFEQVEAGSKFFGIPKEVANSLFLPEYYSSNDEEWDDITLEEVIERVDHLLTLNIEEIETSMVNLQEKAWSEEHEDEDDEWDYLDDWEDDDEDDDPCY